MYIYYCNTCGAFTCTDLKILHLGIAPVAVKVMNLQETNMRTRIQNMVGTTLYMPTRSSEAQAQLLAAQQGAMETKLW